MFFTATPFLFVLPLITFSDYAALSYVYILMLHEQTQHLFVLPNILGTCTLLIKQ